MIDKVQSTYAYDVFLSYRHKPLDNKICKQVHTLLETYKPPKRYKHARIQRVFRDDDELPVAGILSDTIGEALLKTNCLLVICSPDTPESQWVDREVRTFIEMGRSDKIFALLIKGTPEESFPKSLHKVQGIESRILRIEGKTEKQMVRALKRQIIKIVAEATDAPYDSLRIAHRRRNTRKHILTAAGLTLLITLSGLYSLYQWVKASYSSLYAKREEILITDVINGLTFELPDAIGNIPGTKPIIAQILDENTQYLDRMIALDGKKSDAVIDKANNYLALCKAWVRLADTDKATHYAQEAIKIYENNIDRNPELSELTGLYRSYSMAGITTQAAGDYDESQKYYKKALEVAQQIFETNPSAESKAILAESYIFLGDCILYTGQTQKAKSYYEKGLELYEELLLEDEGITASRLAEVYQSIGTQFYNFGDYQNASVYLEQSISSMKDSTKEGIDPTVDLAAHYLELGLNFINLNDPDKAIEAFQQALLILLSNQSDMKSQLLTAEAYAYFGAAYQLKEEHDKALSYFQKCLEIRLVFAEDKDNLFAQEALSQIYQQLGNHHKLMGEYQESIKYYQACVGIINWLVHDKNEFALNENLGIALNDMGTVYMSQGDNDKAKSAFLEAAACFEKINQSIDSVNIKANLAICYNNSGLCDYNRTLYDHATGNFIKAAEIREQLLTLQNTPQNRKTLADTYNYIGNCLTNTYGFEKAEGYHDKCIQIYSQLVNTGESLDYKQGYAIALYAASLNLFCLDKTTEAEKHYKLSLHTADQAVNGGLDSFRSTYYAMYSFYYLLFDNTQLQKSLEVGQMALEENPHNAFARQIYSYGLLFNNHYEDALQELVNLSEKDPYLLKSIKFDFTMLQKNDLSSELMNAILTELTKGPL